MTGLEIAQKVNELGLAEGSYVVFGSAPMALAGIREAQDIDLLVSEATFQELLAKGWKPVQKGSNDEPLVMGNFEAHANWRFSPYSPTLETLLATATTFHGVSFAALDEVRKWKAASGGAKHIVDVIKINNYQIAHDTCVQEIIQSWQPYIASIKDWEVLVEGIATKPSGCGQIYELANPLPGRPNEDFCIADMRNLNISEPHYHPTGHYELYFIMQGCGKFMLGYEEVEAKAGEVIVNLPNVTHVTLPDRDMVLAAVSAPPFQPDTYIAVDTTDHLVQFDVDQLNLLKAEVKA